MPHDLESIRAFILQAPPGQLQEVLKSLHTLCGGSATFFSAIPDLCLEYTMRHLCAFPLGDTDSQATVMSCKHNHLTSRIKKLSRRSGVNVDNIVAEFLAYFESYRGVSPIPEDDLAPFDRFDFVFFDYSMRIYFELDPVEGKVVRCKRFADKGSATESMHILQSPTALHDNLVQRIGAYVHESFGAEAWWQQGRHRMFLGEQADDVRSKLSKKQRTSRNVAGSHVSAESDDTYIVAISCERYAPSSRWAARWKSLYQIRVVAEVATVEGEGRIDGHYFEDSNVHVSVEDVMPETQVPNEVDLAEGICKVVDNAEADLQRKLEKHSKEVSESALKGLRRRLPVTKQPFDFHKAMLQLPSAEERF
jgi:hypothetical protein